MTTHRRSKEHYLGCLIGGAVGDALGAAVEFDSLAAIRRKFGPLGIEDYAPAYGRLGAITDDTQMTLFTAEALIRGHNRWLERGLCSPKCVANLAYLRWLRTQGETPKDESHEPGWLIQQGGLHHRRAPGTSCLSALAAGGGGSKREPINNSKGCGGVMRMAPVGLTSPGMLDAFDEGASFAALTHGHPSGYLAAGFFAELIAALAQRETLPRAIEQGLTRLDAKKGHEVRSAVQQAVDLAASSQGTPEDVEQLGAGWVAEEALAIGIYCALKGETYARGVLGAVNHSGDSDSTGSITGNILGLMYGVQGISEHWLERLELRDVIEEVATDLWIHFGEGEKPEWADFGKQGVPPDWAKYPGN